MFSLSVCPLFGQTNIEERLLKMYDEESYQLVVNAVDSLLEITPSGVNVARLYQIKADALYFLNDVEASLENYLNTIANLDEYPIDTMYLIESYGHAAFCYNYLGMYVEAIPYYENALRIAQAVNDSTEIANQLSQLGDIYGNLGNYQKASRFIDKAYAINFALKDTVALAYDLIDLGDLKCHMGDYNAAIGYYKQGMAIKQTKAGNHNTYALRLGKLSDAFLRNHQVDSAKKYNEMAIEEALALQDSLTLAKQWIVKTRILNYTGNFNEALTYGKKCADYFEGFAASQYQVSSAFALADAYQGSSRYSQAEVILDSIISKANRQQLIENLALAYKKKAELYEKRSDTKNALHYYKIYQSTRDSIQSRNKQQAILTLEQEYQSSKKEQELDLLRARDKVSQLQLAEERQNIIYLSVLLVLIIMISIYIYYTIKKKHQLQNELLTAQVNELRTQIKVALERDTTPLEIDINQFNQTLNTPLSEREFEILNFALTDLSNSEIADKAYVSVNTVKFHLKNVYEKLGVGNRKEALQFAIQRVKSK